MKNKCTYRLIIAFATIVISAYTLQAQAPQQMNYQAVVRDNKGNTVANGTPVSLRFTIHNLSANGDSVYGDIITTTANQFGLVNVAIGANSSLAVVDWSSGAKYLQVEVDVNNTGTYTDMGTPQLLSVPYALFAANSNIGPPGPTGIGATGNTGATGATGPTGT